MTRSIVAITLALVLGLASLGLSQVDERTVQNAISFLLDLINVQSEQIDQIRIEQAQQGDKIQYLSLRIDAIEAQLNALQVQTPSSK